MKKSFLFLLAFCSYVEGFSQDKDFFKVSPDSSTITLTMKGATHLASLPMKCIGQEYPNKTSHTSASDSDHVVTPQQLHPAFYGCFDWHSSVHGHWMLIKILKEFRSLPEAASLRQQLNKSLTISNIQAELKYFDLPFTSSWERTYGWGWILKLQEELDNWNDSDGIKWSKALQPLSTKIVELWKNFLPRQTYPNRTGVHPNTAFGLVFALDYSRSSKDTSFENAITKSAVSLFSNDRNIPAEWEPNGSDFLSPSLEEADLMRRILDKTSFLKWFELFISKGGVKHLTILPVVSDRSDLQIVHLDGLSFSRSWCMKGIASALPAGNEMKSTLIRSSVHHLSTALANVASGEYGGEHWLASFAVYALLNGN